jgi:hypothetical protein
VVGKLKHAFSAGDKGHEEQFDEEKMVFRLNENFTAV